jgi:hypothetical protein
VGANPPDETAALRASEELYGKVWAEASNRTANRFCSTKPDENAAGGACSMSVDGNYAERDSARFAQDD